MNLILPMISSKQVEQSSAAAIASRINSFTSPLIDANRSRTLRAVCASAQHKTINAELIRRSVNAMSATSLKNCCERIFQAKSFSFFSRGILYAESSQLKIIFPSQVCENFFSKISSFDYFTFVTVWTWFAFAFYRLKVSPLQCSLRDFLVQGQLNSSGLEKGFPSAAWLNRHRLTKTKSSRIGKSFSKSKFSCLWIFSIRERKFKNSKIEYTKILHVDSAC